MSWIFDVGCHPQFLGEPVRISAGLHNQAHSSDVEVDGHHPCHLRSPPQSRGKEWKGSWDFRTTKGWRIWTIWWSWAAWGSAWPWSQHLALYDGQCWIRLQKEPWPHSSWQCWTAFGSQWIPDCRWSSWHPQLTVSWSSHDKPWWWCLRSQNQTVVLMLLTLMCSLRTRPPDGATIDQGPDPKPDHSWKNENGVVGAILKEPSWRWTPQSLNVMLRSRVLMLTSSPEGPTGVFCFKGHSCDVTTSIRC